MDNNQRAVAQFWARLASIPSLKELREGEKLLLLEDFKNLLVFPWLTPLMQDDSRFPKTGAPFKDLDSTLQRALVPLYADAHAIIGRLLDGETIPAPVDTMPPLSWKLEDRVLHEQPALLRFEFWVDFFQMVLEVCTVELVTLLRLRPFPFKRCPVCQSVFVPTGKKMYCSPICAIRAAEDARKETKREYMREYMAKKRKQTKAREGRKEV